MRLRTESLPSSQEAKKETDKRLRLIDYVKKEFKIFCEVILVVGSVAMGKNFSVRKKSDIDIILMLKRENIDQIKTCPLIKITPKYEEAINYFKNGQVDHFSINTEFLEGVEMQYHFWDIDAHFRTIEDESFIPKVYNVWRTDGNPLRKNPDFKGIELSEEAPIIKKCNYGVIHNYPAYLKIDGKTVLMQPILNLIAYPIIVYSNNKKIYGLMEGAWNLVARKFIEEKESYYEENPIRFIAGNWSYSQEARKNTIKSFREALIRQGYEGRL